MYKILQIEVSGKDALYPYLMNIGRLSNNLYNAILFRQRQLMTSRNKDVLSVNEQSILNEVDIMNLHLVERHKPARLITKSGVVSYNFMDDLLKFNHNVDYKHKEIPTHTAQHVVKNVVQNIKAFFESVKAYNENPSAFKGRPQMPRYKHKGGVSSFKFSNQECVIKQNKKGRYVAKLPYTKETICLGKKVYGKLKEVSVSFNNNTFIMAFIFDDGILMPQSSDTHDRICAIDMGINNLMAITNNIGCPNFLYKGGYLKSINHLYNKKIAHMQSVNTIGTTEKYKPSKRYYGVTFKRNHQIKDYISKVSKHFIQWCVENRIDTIVVGNNKQWKDSIDLGRSNNQQFVQIPHAQLINNLKYRAEQNGICFIETEESYTSKASYLDRDVIPIYNETDNDAQFSGKRIKRGLYKSKDGIIINADLNGSANIMRKFKDDVLIAFDQIMIFKYVTL